MNTENAPVNLVLIISRLKIMSQIWHVTCVQLCTSCNNYSMGAFFVGNNIASEFPMVYTEQKSIWLSDNVIRLT